MSAKVVPESGSKGWYSLKTSTAEPPHSLTDVSLRQVGGVWGVAGSGSTGVVPEHRYREAAFVSPGTHFPLTQRSSP